MAAARPRRPSVPRAPTSVLGESFRTARATNGAIPSPLLEKRRARAEQRLEEALAASRAKPSEELNAKIAGLIQRWAKRAFEDGFEDAERFELECFEAEEIAEAREAGDADRLLAAMEKKHRAAVVAAYGRIELRGLQMSERVFQGLDLAYVPLRIQDDSHEGEVIRGEAGIEIRSGPRLSVPELIAKHSHAVLVGAPGSGKTTIVAYLAAHAAEEKLQHETGWQTSPVPFVVAVRSLSGNSLDIETIAGAAGGVDIDFVQKVFAKGRGFLLVDGLDEAHQSADALLPSLLAFAAAYPGNRMLVTTRPAVVGGSERVEVPGFVITSLLPMDREDVYQFIDRWCLSAEMSIQKDRARAEQEATKAAEDLKARVRSSRPVERLAETPLMCSVICIVHRFLGQKIPERRVALYEACTNVLLYEWDRAKFPDTAAIGKLDAQDKRFLLGGLARSMHVAWETEVAAEDVIKHFSERLPLLNRSSDEAECIVQEIQLRSGILVERRPGIFAFSHLAFQEYLTALDVVREGNIKELASNRADWWWHEVIVLAAGLPWADAGGLIQALLDADSSAVSYATILAARCAGTAVNLATSIRQEVERRLSRLLPLGGDFDAYRFEEMGDIVVPVLLRELEHAGPDIRAKIAVVLSRMGHELSYITLVKMLDDMQPVNPATGVDIGSAYCMAFPGAPVSSYAAAALFNLSLVSPLARSALEHAIPQVDSQTLSILELYSSINLEKENHKEAFGHEAVERLIELRHLIEARDLAKPPPKPDVHSG